MKETQRMKLNEVEEMNELGHERQIERKSRGKSQDRSRQRKNCGNNYRRGMSPTKRT